MCPILSYQNIATLTPVYQLDKYLGTIPDTPCIANYDNSLENSSHTNPHFLTGVHPV